jgi:hypothetical protein
VAEEVLAALDTRFPRALPKKGGYQVSNSYHCVLVHKFVWFVTYPTIAAKAGPIATMGPGLRRDGSAVVSTVITKNSRSDISGKDEGAACASCDLVDLSGQAVRQIGAAIVTIVSCPVQ